MLLHSKELKWSYDLLTQRYLQSKKNSGTRSLLDGRMPVFSY
jgi:hypothetical protein